MGVEEAGVDEALGDSLLSGEGLVTLEASYVGEPRLDSLRGSLVCPNGRVVHILGVRSFRCDSGRRTNRCHSCYECRVRDFRVNSIAR
jgi:hypothetical protein